MPTPAELEGKFWSALADDKTMMLGLHAADEGHTRPMTAQLDGQRGPIWFFTVKDSALVSELDEGRRAVATFASKGHDVFAAVHGVLSLENDGRVVDRFWNAGVAAWYEGGKNDPRLAMVRLDPEDAEIWENASGLLAGLKLLLGRDPKSDYREQVAKVHLRSR